LALSLQQCMPLDQSSSGLPAAAPWAHPPSQPCSPASHVRRRVQRPCHLDPHSAQHHSLLEVPAGAPSLSRFDPSDRARLTCFPRFCRRFAVVERRWRAAWEAARGTGRAPGRRCRPSTRSPMPLPSAGEGSFARWWIGLLSSLV
jgi:hypothetical protein